MFNNFQEIVDSDYIESYFQEKVVFWQNNKNVIQKCTLAMAKLFGFKSDDHMIGNTPFDFKCEAVENAPGFIELDIKAMKTRQPIYAIVVDVFANNCMEIYWVKKSPTFQKGQVNGVLTVGEPITINSPMAEAGYHLARCHYRNSSHFVKNELKFCYQAGPKFPDLDLSEREAECLFYLVRGLTARAIAALLSISIRTVEWHVNEMKEKLIVNSKQELIGLAIMKGYMHYIPPTLLNKKLIIKL